MNRIATTVSVGFASAVALAALLITGTASAEGTTVRKPTVCADFKTFERGGAVVGVCFDGKRRKVFSTWTTVKLVNPEGVSSSYTVGF
jgi:hypothetical protein